jgi:hypothetical protein
MLSEVLREYDSFCHYFGIRGIHRFPLNIKWAKSLGTVQLQILSLASYLLCRLPVLANDLS